MKYDVEPFLRWAGGKRWLAKHIAPALRKRLTGRYYEPFLGSGAMFFAVAPKCAILSDLNGDLINAYKIVQKHPTKLLETIRKIPVAKDSYYQLRESEPNDEFERAVRFIFLNRTCYGGLYRENRSGKFNVPFGGGSRTPEPLWSRELIKKSSDLLLNSNTRLEVTDFSHIISEAEEGDIIYCDPTYQAVTRDKFDRYGAIIFSWEDQKRLAFEASKARDRGALVLISNTYDKDIRALYPDGIFRLCEKQKTIGNYSKDPKRHKEYLVILDPLEKKYFWKKLRLNKSR